MGAFLIRLLYVCLWWLFLWSWKDQIQPVVLYDLNSWSGTRAGKVCLWFSHQLFFRVFLGSRMQIVYATEWSKIFLRGQINNRLGKSKRTLQNEFSMDTRRQLSSGQCWLENIGLKELQSRQQIHGIAESPCYWEVCLPPWEMIRKQFSTAYRGQIFITCACLCIWLIILVNNKW